MASDLKKRTQVAIDTVRADVEGCSLAMLIDGETGLVLCKTSSTVVSQDKLDELATTAKENLDGPLSKALMENASATDMLTRMQIGKDATIVTVRAAQSSQDALICQFTSPPNRADLSLAARAVFDLTTDEEAA